MSQGAALTVWELDFYSRPLLDENQKKLWELLICDRQQQFQFVKYCSGGEANARWLQAALAEALQAWQEQTGLDEAAQPDKIRFFRRQMNSIITRACEEAGLPAIPSRRTFSLYRWLREREAQVYPQHPGYQPLAAPPVVMEPALPQALPDALRGDKWVFASLKVADFAESNEWETKFGEVFPLTELGLDLAPDDTISGLIIYSARALPLAGWLSGLELAALDLIEERTPQLVLETGVGDRWILLNLRQATLLAEARAFVAAKQKSAQVHFLAVQADAKSETFAGFWVLQAPDLL